jgi:hypothetical protein
MCIWEEEREEFWSRREEEPEMRVGERWCTFEEDDNSYESKALGPRHS